MSEYSHDGDMEKGALKSKEAETSGETTNNVRAAYQFSA